jgi:hypothetical protein
VAKSCTSGARRLQLTRDELGNRQCAGGQRYGDSLRRKDAPMCPVSRRLVAVLHTGRAVGHQAQEGGSSTSTGPLARATSPGDPTEGSVHADQLDLSRSDGHGVGAFAVEEPGRAVQRVSGHAPRHARKAVVQCVRLAPACRRHARIWGCVPTALCGAGESKPSRPESNCRLLVAGSSKR